MDHLPLPIHPFPARMAPEIALREVAGLPAGARVLDPMAGSGTVVRVAAESGHFAVGFDLDPLAVLMARVWTTPIDTARLRSAAADLIGRARRGEPDRVAIPWIDADPETAAFVNYWFAPRQQADLRRLSAALHALQGPMADALRIALSRIIITKDRGASLARDVSHSRPHRVRLSNDFPVFDEFLRSVTRLAQRLDESPLRRPAEVSIGDARNLAGIVAASIDAVITSPPYLNAIDYLRGHRLSLVWLGYRLAELRAIRAGSIGTERGVVDRADLALAEELIAPLGSLQDLPPAEQRMILRYGLDLRAMLSEIHRVLRPGGKAVFVVGNSCIRGTFIHNARALVTISERLGFRLHTETERPLPPNRRYLPPPHTVQPSELVKRMRSETVLTYVSEG